MNNCCRKIIRISCKVLAFVLFFVVSIPAYAVSGSISSSTFQNSLDSLRSQYPNYSTWTGNYAGGKQCWGFARLVADKIFGGYCNTEWPKVYDISNVKAGDILQYGNTSGSGHTVFVTNVSGDVITFVDCNGNGNYSGGSKVRSCGIKWDNTISKSAKMFNKYSFSYLMQSPGIDNGNNPIGNIDSISGGTNSVSICGWAFDADDTSQSLYVDVYIGDAAGGSTAEGHRLTADSARPDVNNVYGVGNNHGLDCTFHTDKTGEQMVYVYAINVGNGEHTILWADKITIKSGKEPKGCIESISGSPGKLNISGWAFDEDDVSKSIELHVYIGGPCGSSNASGYRITANKKRSDVNNVYGVGDYHGVSAEISTSKTGSQPVYIYAIDVGSELANPLIHSSTVSIPEYIPVSSVSITDSKNVSCENYILKTIDEKVTLKAKVFPSNATTQDVTWSSGDTSVASVNASGVVTAKNYGTVYITVKTKEGNNTAACLLRVVNGNVVYGDVNEDGRINSLDLSVMSKVINGATTLTDAQKVICDLNGDTKIDTEDVDLLKNFIVGLITEFPVESLLDYIKVTTLPSKTTYFVGEEIATSGLKVTAYYRNGNSKDITSYKTKGAADTEGNQQIAITYTEAGVTRQASYTIVVKKPELTGLVIVQQPKKLSYIEGDTFDTAGMSVQAKYNNGSNKVITGYQVNLTRSLNVSDKKVEITYQEGTQVVSAYQEISVKSTCEAYGHSFNSWISKDTDTHKKICGICRIVEEEKCDFDITEIEPTWNEEGYTLHQCSKCHNSYKDNFKEALIKTSPIQKGDVDGDGKVNMKDYSLLQRYLNNWDVFIINEAADMNADGKVDMKDYALLQRYLNGWE